MLTVQKHIEIRAPIADVFEIFTDPVQLNAIWPSLTEVTNVKGSLDKGYTFDFVYKMAGIRITGKTELIAHKKNEYCETRTTGIPAVFRWHYEPKGDFTLVRAEVEYTLPVPVLGKLAEKVVAKMNEREFEQVLENAKSSLEMPLPPKELGRREVRA